MDILNLNRATKEATKDNASVDSLGKQDMSDTRKPVLTLKHLNKLRKMRELTKLEQMMKDVQLGIIFGEESAESTDI